VSYTKGRTYIEDVFEQSAEENAWISKKGSNRMEKLYNEELQYLHSLPNIIRVIKLGRLDWAGHVACVE
jgi:hypothetical protein